MLAPDVPLRVVPNEPRVPGPKVDLPTLELLERWRSGDRAALDQLLAEVEPWLHREMRNAVGDELREEQDSLDLAHAAVLNFLAWGPRFVPESPAQFRALLKRIAMNEIVDQRRRLGRRGARQRLDSLSDSRNSLSGYGVSQGSSHRPSRAAELSEETEWVRLALQFLEPDDRYLLLASEVEGLDWATIAAELGIATPDAARVRCARLKPRVGVLLLQLRRGKLPAEA
jgi:RNA polymerase sigma factor (sigma-70 family)